MPGYMPWCFGRTEAEVSEMTTRRSGVYHLLPMLYVEVRIKFLGLEYVKLEKKSHRIETDGRR